MGQQQVTQIVAAAQELPQGIALSNKDLVLLDWPSDVPLTGSISKIEAVIGHPLLHSLGAKEPVLLRDLAVEGSGVGLATKIPPGMRATAVRSNEIVGVAGFLYPGSRVDVMATYSMPGTAGSLTQTVLQDVEVLAAGQTIEADPQGKPEQVNVVTLLLSPEDSQRLQLASTQGTIQFVLRNGTDKQVAKLNPTHVSELVSGGQPTTPVPTKTVRHAPTPVPPRYVLEVIQGTQRTVHKFDEAKKEQVTK